MSQNIKDMCSYYNSDVKSGIEYEDDKEEYVNHRDYLFICPMCGDSLPSQEEVNKYMSKCA